MKTSLLFAAVKLALWACVAAISANPWAAKAAPGDEHWDPQFGWAGPGNNNYAVAMHNGRTYVCGTALSTNVALEVWDGVQWSALSQIYGSLPALVYDMAFLGDTLYVAGLFTNIDGVAVTNFAKWDGTNRVYSTGTNVYVGGNFSLAGGQLANGLAVWDGANWSVIGAAGRTNGLLSSVTALASDGANLYAGGSFTVAGETPANYIARFDGTKWNAMGTGLSGSSTPSVRAIALRSGTEPTGAPWAAGS